MKRCLLLFLVGFAPLWAQSLATETLFLPCLSVKDEDLDHVYQLFKEDSKGRTLLREAIRKLKMRDVSELAQIYSLVAPEALGGSGERRGLIRWKTARYYRHRGETKWFSTHVNGMALLEDEAQNPQLARRYWTTTGFEHMEVAFRPVILIRAGLTQVQVFLVLYHELTHLVGVDPFHRPDVFRLDLNNLEKDYYGPELRIKGGEVDAFLAQLRAFRELKSRYPIEGINVLEGFLSDTGRLLHRDRKAFESYLLDRANYRDTLWEQLQNEAQGQYDICYAWWDFFEKNLEILDKEYGLLKQYSEQAESDGAVKLPSDFKARLALNRQRHRAYSAEQRDYLRQLEDLAERFGD